MEERPILFSAPMVLAILAGRKTQTRRLYKPRNPEPYEIMGELDDGRRWPHWFDPNQGPDYNPVPCPHGEIGDRLWVKEKFKHYGNGQSGTSPVMAAVIYAADNTHADVGSWKTFNEAPTRKEWGTGKSKWIPSLFMPRWASRITLEITEVRVQRLQEISEKDAEEEGAEFFDGWTDGDTMVGREPQVKTPNVCDPGYRAGFALLWDRINRKRASWVSNPWVWAISFRRIETAGGPVPVPAVPF